MPSYYLQKNVIVIDSHNEGETTFLQDIFGSAPTAKHSEAHDIYTREHLENLQLLLRGDEDQIYDEVIRRGGYMYADVEYDFESFLVTITYMSYWPSQADFESYHEWLMTKTIFVAHPLVTSIAKKTDNPREDYLNPDNSPGRGYTNVTYSTVDFNKPYRT